MSKIDLQSSILKTLKDDSIDHLVCVKFDGGGKESEVLELTYSDVKFLIKQLCEIFQKNFQNQCPAVIGLKFDINKPSIVYILPSIIAVLNHPLLSFQVCDVDDEDDQDNYNAMIQITEEDNKRDDFVFGPSAFTKLNNKVPQISDAVYHVKTSGSKCKKLISVPSQSIWSNVLDFQHIFQLKSEDVIFSAAPPNFDPFYLDILLSFLNGGCLLLTSQSMKILGGTKLVNILNQNRVSFCQMTPSLFRSLPRDLPSSLKYLLLGGEPFPSEEEILQKSWIGDSRRLFNVYGLTEMSVWQSLVEVPPLKFHDYPPPIYCSKNLLSGAKLTVQADTTKDIKKSQETVEGEICIESKLRACYYDGQKNEIVYTKDLGYTTPSDVGRKIYFKSRMDDVFKIHGRRLSIELIEEKWKTIVKVPSFCILNEDKKLLGFFQTSQGVEDLYKKLKSSLPSYMVPQIILNKFENPKRNLNGKIDKKYLKELIARNGIKIGFSATDSLEDLWRFFTGHDPNDESRFIYDGGDSFLAVSFAECLDSESNAKIVELLLNQSFKDLKDHIEKFNIPFVNSPSSEDFQKPTKILKFHDDEKDEHLASSDHQILAVKNKNAYWFLKVLWKQNLQKCIDASPVFHEGKIIIGSHKGILGCYQIMTGKIIWCLQLDDRIEATATISQNFVYLGTYSGSFYRIDISTGKIIWCVRLDDTSSPVIKTKAIVLGSYGIAFGCHDFCVLVNKDDGTIKWATKLQGSISSLTPSFDQNFAIICTLGGYCYTIDGNGKVISRIFCHAPIFSTPGLINNKDLILVTVIGCVHKIDLKNDGAGEVAWKFSVSKQIYAPIFFFDNYHYLLCSQDGQCLAYALHQSSGKTIWQWKNENPIIAGACIHNDNLIITDTKSIVTKLTTGGTFLDQTDLQIAETFSTPVINSDCIYLGSRDDHLYCFQMQ